jgi:hypothetical protein
MDQVIQAATVLGAFAAVQERIVEMFQQMAKSNSWLATLASLGGLFSWHEEGAIDRKNAALAIVLALGTHANLLDLFATAHPADGANAIAFFVNYMHFTTWADFLDYFSVQHVFGCILMGLSTGLGSKFWHDVTSGLVDIRSKAQAVASAAQPGRNKPAPAVPPGETVS